MFVRGQTRRSRVPRTNAGSSAFVAIIFFLMTLIVIFSFLFVPNVFFQSNVLSFSWYPVSLTTNHAQMERRVRETASFWPVQLFFCLVLSVAFHACYSDRLAWKWHDRPASNHTHWLGATICGSKQNVDDERVRSSFNDVPSTLCSRSVPQVCSVEHQRPVLVHESSQLLAQAARGDAGSNDIRVSQRFTSD